MGEVLLALVTWAAIFAGLGLGYARQVARRGRRRTAEDLRPENQLRTWRRALELSEKECAQARAMGWSLERPEARLARARERLAALEAQFPELAARAKAKAPAQRESGAGGGDRTLAETDAVDWRKA